MEIFDETLFFDFAFHNIIFEFLSFILLFIQNFIFISVLFKIYDSMIIKFTLNLFIKNIKIFLEMKIVISIQNQKESMNV